MRPGRHLSTDYASTKTVILVILNNFLLILDLLAFWTGRVGDVLDDFPRRTRISMVALGAFIDFAGEGILGLMPAGVVIPVLRTHFERIEYESRRWNWICRYKEGGAYRKIVLQW
jgi:hypothetical protein